MVAVIGMIQYNSVLLLSKISLSLSFLFTKAKREKLNGTSTFEIFEGGIRPRIAPRNAIMSVLSLCLERESWGRLLDPHCKNSLYLIAPRINAGLLAVAEYYFFQLDNHKVAK